MGLVARALLPEYVRDVKVETFVAGDVHGHASLLDGVLTAIEHYPRTPGVDRRFVQIGDLIDRGPESLRALDLMIAAEARMGHPVHTLMGNHEMMLAGTALEGDMGRRWWCLEMWYKNGGNSVFDEFEEQGIDTKKPSPDMVREAIGPERVAFLESLPSHFKAPDEDLLFVHAGVHHMITQKAFLGIPWRAMMDDDFKQELHWAWIRETFLDYVPSSKGETGHQGSFVIHGHTPYDGVRRPVADQVARDRLNLDAGAFSRGSLRFARIFGRQIDVFELGYVDLQP